VKGLRRIVASSIVIVVLAVGAVGVQIATLASERHPDLEGDVALVLGAAVWGDAPSPVFQARIDHGLDLYRQGRVEHIVFTGGSRSDSVRAESEVARAYALAAGISEAAVSTEAMSHTTAQNLACSLPFLRQLDAETVILVSDPLHLWRARWMARDLGMDVRVSPTPTTRYQSLTARSRFWARETYFAVVYAGQRLAGSPECPEDGR